MFASLSVRDNLLAVLHERHANPSHAAGGTRRGGGVTNPYLRLWTEGVPQRAAIPELAARAQQWLDRLDLAAVADQHPHQVPAGLRRRAALAGALAVEAPCTYSTTSTAPSTRSTGRSSWRHCATPIAAPARPC